MRLLFALAVILPVVLLSPSLAQGEGPNLLVNGGFEEAEANGTPLGWSYSAGTLTWVDAPYHGTVGAAELKGQNDPAEHEVYQRVPVEPGGAYSLSAWVIQNDTSIQSIQLEISWLDSQLALLQWDASDSASHSPDYQQLSVPLEPAPCDAAWADVKLVVTPVSTLPFAAYIDDASFQLLSPGSCPTPSPTPASSPTPVPTPTPTLEPDVFPVLTNGGFEQGRADGTPLAWRKFGGGLARSSQFRFEGDYAAALTSGTATQPQKTG